MPDNITPVKITMPDVPGVLAALHVAHVQARRLLDAQTFIEKMCAALDEAGTGRELRRQLLMLAEGVLLDPPPGTDPFGDTCSCLQVASVPFIDAEDCEAIDVLYGRGFAGTLLASSPAPDWDTSAAVTR